MAYLWHWIPAFAVGCLLGLGALLLEPLARRQEKERRARRANEPEAERP